MAVLRIVGLFALANQLEEQLAKARGDVGDQDQDKDEDR